LDSWIIMTQKTRNLLLAIFILSFPFAFFLVCLIYNLAAHKP